jgi:hypothetical protein
MNVSILSCSRSMLQIGLKESYAVEFREYLQVLTRVRLQTSVAHTTVAQTECSNVFILTVAYALMYHRGVRFFPTRALWAVAEIGRQDGLRIRWRKS